MRKAVSPANDKCELGRELKRLNNRSIVEPLRELAATGLR
jgi:hypothetical protein